MAQNPRLFLGQNDHLAGALCETFEHKPRIPPPLRAARVSRHRNETRADRLPLAERERAPGHLTTPAPTGPVGATMGKSGRGLQRCIAPDSTDLIGAGGKFGKTSKFCQGGRAREPIPPRGWKPAASAGRERPPHFSLSAHGRPSVEGASGQERYADRLARRRQDSSAQRVQRDRRGRRAKGRIYRGTRDRRSSPSARDSAPQDPARPRPSWKDFAGCQTCAGSLELVHLHPARRLLALA
jgi:hypothetical protein